MEAGEEVRKDWTAQEKQYLAANHAEKTNAELAVELKKTKAAIAAMAHDMGLRKTKEHKVRAWRKARGL